MDLEANLRQYLDEASAVGGHKPEARCTSFDYCFNYFQSFRDAGDPMSLASSQSIEHSCLQLGLFLASWGMFRGSSELLQKSARQFVPIVKAIASTEPCVWEIDADRYTESNIEALLSLSSVLRQAKGGMTDTLVTKVMLGVFGSVPAFDTSFRNGFGSAAFGPKALRRIGSFYARNAEVLDRFRVPTLDFSTGEPTKRLYTRAKVIDMAFYIEGM